MTFGYLFSEWKREITDNWTITVILAENGLMERYYQATMLLKPFWTEEHPNGQ